MMLTSPSNLTALSLAISIRREAKRSMFATVVLFELSQFSTTVLTFLNLPIMCRKIFEEPLTSRMIVCTIMTTSHNTEKRTRTTTTITVEAEMELRS